METVKQPPADRKFDEGPAETKEINYVHGEGRASRPGGDKSPRLPSRSVLHESALVCPSTLIHELSSWRQPNVFS